MANVELKDEAYPTAVDPRLIAADAIPSEGLEHDNDLIHKTAETEEHIGFIRKVLGIVAA